MYGKITEMYGLHESSGIVINGNFINASSAKLEAPALVMQRSDLIKNLFKSFSKTNI